MAEPLIECVPNFSEGRRQDVIEAITAEIAGVKRQWEAKILEQVPDQKVAWAATEGATNAGSVTFEDMGGGQTSVTLHLEYEPEGLVEKVGEKLNIVEKQVQGDLERFKAFIEDEGYATGAWRGQVNEGAGVGTPGVEDADSSRGDDGKAGISLKAAAAGLGVAAAAGAAVAASRGSSDEETTSEPDVSAPMVATTPVDVVEVQDDVIVIEDDALADDDSGQPGRTV